MFRRTASDLGLDQVLQTVGSLSLSAQGSEYVKAARPVRDTESWVIRQNQVSDVYGCIVLSAEEDVNVQAFPDIRPVFSQIEENPTASIDGNLIYDVAMYIESAVLLRQLFCLYNGPDRGESDIRHIIPEVDTKLVYLRQEILKVLEAPGMVKESYPTVKALIDKADRCRHDRTREAGRMMRDNYSFMQQDQAVLRDGRIVLPVRNELRSQMEGYVQGSSQSGSTVFMEPFKLVDLNNSVNLAMQEIQIEIARLLKMLSDLVRDAENELRILYSQITFADFLYSFARWALDYNCCKVLPAEERICNLIHARHPLLKEKCVPIDLVIDRGTKAVVLTGPNAGGKTVTMKTVGLFAFLNQICGYVPASDGTSLEVFDKVFTDIGDDQSIENHLSTFSGHMSNIGFILRTMTSRSLVILDELGSGTDPQEGAALARSIMEYCTSKAQLTLTTSHHGVLKQYAYASDIVLNASMEFDEKTLEPTFKVINGLPGESHAIDTARRMHLPKEVTQAARRYMGDEAVKISAIIRGLEQKQKEARDREEEIKTRLDEVLKQQKALEARSRELDRLENRLRQQELSDFDDHVRHSRKKLEGLVRELREGEITKEKTRKVRDHILALEKEKGAMEQELEQKRKELDSKDYQELIESRDNVELKPGMDVLCGQYKREGTVIRSDGKGKWVVAIGPMKFTFKETDLTVPQRAGSNVKSYSFDKGSSSPKPKLQLDLRGYRLLDALEAIDDQIEACCVHGITTFSVVHGYGDGILSTGIHKHLAMKANVARFNFALPEDGGQGKTYVTLK